MTAVPPQNLEAEEHVLGAMVVSQATVPLVTATGLAPEHFYRDRHGLIHGAIRRLAARLEPVDVLTVPEELKRSGELARVGEDTVSLLAAKVPAPGNAGHYAEIVLRHARAREVDAVAKRLSQSVAEHEDIEDAVSAAMTQLGQHGVADRGEPVEPHELAADFFDFLNDPEDVDVFELPWPALNRYCAGGFRRCQITILTGPTGDGKSSALDQILSAFAKKGYRCGIFATEMTHRERMARWLSMKTGIPYHRLILKRSLSKRDRERLLPWLNGERLPPWSFRNAENWTVQRMAQDILARKLDVAAIDPINLIPGANKTESMEAIAQELKVLATRANCHIIAVAHLTKSASRFRERPTLGDIRQSGMIEANASQVMVLHRDRDEKANTQLTGWLGFIKARDGIPDGIEVEFKPGKYRFDTKDAGTGSQEAMDTDEPRGYGDPEDVFG